MVGQVSKPDEFDAGRLMRGRFHPRTIVRDRRDAFLGSQSLREVELDKRRELGLIVRDREIVRSLVNVFERDWRAWNRSIKTHAKKPTEGESPPEGLKAVARELPLTRIVQDAVIRAVGELPNFELRRNDLRHNLTEVVKEAVEGAVAGMVAGKSSGARITRGCVGPWVAPHSSTNVLEFARLLRPYAGSLSIALLAVLGESLTGLSEPWPLKIVFDTSVDRNRSQLGWRCGTPRRFRPTSSRLWNSRRSRSC